MARAYSKRLSTLKDFPDVLKHIRDECEYLTGLSKTTDAAGFKKDETLKRAAVRSLEIIGEASKKVPDEFRKKHPEMDWKEMAGMRDVLIHDYLGVDYDIVWDVIINYIPPLLARVKTITG